MHVGSDNNDLYMFGNEQIHQKVDADAQFHKMK